MKKRVLSMLLASVMVVSMAACGEDVTGNSGDGSSGAVQSGSGDGSDGTTGGGSSFLHLSHL